MNTPVNQPARGICIPFLPGRSVRDILDSMQLQVRTGCLGTGACGLCRVQVEQGKVSLPTPAERMHIEAADLARGVRLACQAMPLEAQIITILEPVPRSRWNRPRRTHRPMCSEPMPQPIPSDVRYPRGIAVAIDGADVNLSLWDLAGGYYLTGRNGRYSVSDPEPATPAPATTVGGDRRVPMPSGPQILAALRDALQDIAIREGVVLQDVVRVMVVGSADVLSRICEPDDAALAGTLAQRSQMYWVEEDGIGWRRTLDIYGRATIYVVPPLTAEVGSDLMAAVLASGLTERGGGRLLVDFGYVPGVALWDGHCLWAAKLTGASGLAGSGLDCGTPLALPWRDAETLDCARTAVVAGVAALLSRAGMRLADLRQVCVSGVLESNPEMGSALALGLLRDVPPDRVVLVGEAALSGCEHLLFESAARERFGQLRGSARAIELLDHDDPGRQRVHDARMPTRSLLHRR